MTEFPLEAWEWPPESERRFVIEPFEVLYRWPDGVQLTTIFAVPDSPVYFRRLHTDGTLRNYVSTYSEDGDLMLEVPTFYCLHEDNWQVELSRYHRPHFQVHPCRIFHFGDDMALVWDDRGDNPWGEGRATWNYETRFRLPFPAQTRSSREIFEWLQNQLADERSEVHFASRWHRQSGAVDYLYDLVPSLRELAVLLQQVVQLESEIGGACYWQPRLGSAEVIICDAEYNSPASISQALRARLILWQQIFERAFPPNELDTKTTPLCVLDIYQVHRTPRYIVGKAPTAHERLEAGLALRAWAQDKVTPEELKILFPSV